MTLMAPAEDELRQIIRGQLDRTLGRIDLPLGKKYEGKVRSCFGDDQSDAITMVTGDSISAFDVRLGTIPFKGQVLNGLTVHWFKKSAHIAPNHLLRVPDPNVMVVRRGIPLRVEFVVRAYLTGSSSTSILTAYLKGDRIFCGHTLPDGMRKHQRLEHPILTPSTKAPAGQHDQSMSREELIADGWITAEEFDQAAEMCMRMFAFGQAEALKIGLILVDTKFEVFKDPVTGELFFGDELLTADSSRYWELEGYEVAFQAGQDPRALDKEFLRRHLVEELGWKGEGSPPVLSDEIRTEVAMRYIQLYERITGQAFTPDVEEPEARIRRNLSLAA